MLEVIQSYIDISKSSHETFNEHYAMYMMKVQDEKIDEDIRKLFDSSSFETLVEIDREANKLHRNIMKG